MEHDEIPSSETSLETDHDKSPSGGTSLEMEHDESPSNGTSLEMEDDEIPSSETPLETDHDKIPSGGTSLEIEHDESSSGGTSVDMEHDESPSSGTSVETDHGKSPSDGSSFQMDHDKSPSKRASLKMDHDNELNGGSSLEKGEESFKKIQRKKDLEVKLSDRASIIKQQLLIGNVQVLQGKKLTNSPLFWGLLAVVRICLAFIQTGYIHPDEFHQSLQVMAYDILEIDGLKPWEFSSTSPIRTVMFSGLVSLPYMIMKFLSPYIMAAFQIEILTPYALIIAPRLFMTLLSFISDFCIYKISSLCYVRPWQCVEVFAGSYIVLVYSTRTFSNSIELILMSLLLWRVCVSMIDSTKIIRRENVLQDLYETADTIREKVKIYRTKTKLPYYNYVDSFFISVIVTFGFFIRPTFIAFSFVPVAYWLQRGVVTKEVDFSYFNMRCFSLLPGIFLTFIVCVFVDSFYYSSITFSELMFWNVTSASFTVTPINFILYNTNNENLNEHGLHPYFLHIAVNLPVLHGILGILGLWSVSKYFANFIFRKINRKPKIYSMSTMLLTSFIVPVLVLSFIPHQEPRFLLPTLPPLVLLFSEKISIYALPKLKFTKHFFFILWQVWNIFCVIFFGFLHQGGVTKTMVYVHDYVSTQPPTTKFHVFFSHMYSPPTFLLMRKIPVTAVSDDGRKYRIQKTVTTHDLGSSLSMQGIFDELNKTKIGTPVDNLQLVLCITATVSNELKQSLPENTSIEHIKRLPVHFSMEKPPNFHISKSKITRECNELCYMTKRVEELSIDVFIVRFSSDSSSMKSEDVILDVPLNSHDEL